MKRKPRSQVKYVAVPGPAGLTGRPGRPAPKLASILAGVLGALLVVAPLHLAPRVFRAPSSAERAAAVLDQSINVLALEGQGSGVIFYSRHGTFGTTYVLTGAHVVHGIPLRGELTVTRGNDSWTAILVAVDEKRDLALLRLNTVFPVGTGARLAQEELLVGTPLLHVGNVLGLNDSFSRGELSAKGRWIEGQSYHQSSVGAWPGSSGGGVFTVDGKLVGILLRGIGPGLNFFAPVETIRAFAAEHDLQWILK